MQKPDLKNHAIALQAAIIIILAGVLLAPRFASPAPTKLTSPSGDAVMADMPMATKTFEVKPGQPLPTITFTITQDSTGGWDIHASTTNFKFTPEKIDSTAVLGEGHIHLYVDGNLVVVLGDWYHLDPLAAGRHEIRVALANNDHSLYTYQGKDIQQTQTLNVK